MYQQRRQQQVKTYDIHPTSIKLITKGHPWVTLDSYSEKFHPKDRFIVASNRQRPFALLLHDPTHTTIKARVWATTGNFQKQMRSFKNDLINRIRSAVKRRATSKYKEQRNHYYLIFGESDQIPGVLVHYLNGELLIQFYMNFWEQYKTFFIENLVSVVNQQLEQDVSYENIWIQERSLAKNPAKCNDMNISFKNLEVEEFGVKYKVTLGKYYDHGIYTDMASVRSKLSKELEGKESLLNLYCYTGAFSLFALKNDVKEVHSIDLSAPYLEWLENNLALNPDLDTKRHTSKELPVKEALEEYIENKKQFEFIICDPPSSSSDGNKRTNAISEYKELLPLINSALSSNGKAVVFLNTHQTSMRKFEDKIYQIIKKENLPLKVKNKYYLSQDCPYKKGFPEGNYLKGLLLVKNDTSPKPE